MKRKMVKVDGVYVPNFKYACEEILKVPYTTIHMRWSRAGKPDYYSVEIDEKVLEIEVIK